MLETDGSKHQFHLATLAASSSSVNPRRMSQAITRRSILIIEGDEADGAETINSLSEQSQLRSADDESNEHRRALPDFQPAWEQEYQASAYQPREMMLVSLVSAAYFLGHFFGTISWQTQGGDAFAWQLRTWLPELISGGQNGLWLLLLSVPALRGACMRCYDAVCTYIIVTSYFATIVPAFISEFRSQYAAAAAGQPALTLTYSTFPPNRTCTAPAAPAPSNSTAPVAALDPAAAGCAELLLSGATYVAYTLWNIVPRVCRVGTAHAAAVAAVTAAALVVLALALGAGGWTVLACAAYQLATGAGAAYFCRVGERVARDKFATIKGTQFAAEQSGELLFTLVPRSVVARLATHDGQSMLGRELEDCTVMFCSLEPQARGFAMITAVIMIMIIMIMIMIMIIIIIIMIMIIMIIIICPHPRAPAPAVWRLSMPRRRGAPQVRNLARPVRPPRPAAPFLPFIAIHRHFCARHDPPVGP